MAKVTIYNFTMTQWLKDNDAKIEKHLLEVANDLLNEFTTSVERHNDADYDAIRWYGRKRPVVNIVARNKTGWLELSHGGRLTRIAQARKRFKGRLR